MVTLYPILRQHMAHHNLSWSDLAAISGTNKFAFHMKMWGIMQWKLTEALKICCFFSCPDAEHLFVRNHSKSQ